MACWLPISKTARILVVRSLPGLGDLLCSVPALRSLRAAYPQAHITWLGLPGTEWFRQRFDHLLDDWLLFPGFPGIPEGWQGPQATADFLQQVQHQAYDLTLQMHGSGLYINPFLTLLGGQRQAGFYLPGQYCPDPHTFLPYPQQGSEVERLLQLTTFLGMPEQGRALEFPLDEMEHQAGLRLLEAHSLQPGRYVCLHPGASQADRRWSAAGFAEVARQLARQGYRIVLTGTSAELALANQVMAAVEERSMLLPVNLAGRTCLGSLAVLLQQSALLICNDTGISHLAAALRVPSVVVFSNSEVQRWAPSDGLAVDAKRHRGRHCIVDSRITGAATAAAVLAQAKALLHCPIQEANPVEVCYAS